MFKVFSELQLLNAPNSLTLARYMEYTGIDTSTERGLFTRGLLWILSLKPKSNSGV